MKVVRSIEEFIGKRLKFHNFIDKRCYRDN